MLNKINIIGAGVCGLFLGYCLKKNGFNPIIYEKDKSLSDNAVSYTHLTLPTICSV